MSLLVTLQAGPLPQGVPCRSGHHPNCPFCSCVYLPYKLLKSRIASPAPVVGTVPGTYRMPSARLLKSIWTHLQIALLLLQTRVLLNFLSPGILTRDPFPKLLPELGVCPRNGRSFGDLGSKQLVLETINCVILGKACASSVGLGTKSLIPAWLPPSIKEILYGEVLYK